MTPAESNRLEAQRLLEARERRIELGEPHRCIDCAIAVLEWLAAEQDKARRPKQPVPKQGVLFS